MSGASSVRNFSTISIRARTELMFQEAIFREEDMAAGLAAGCCLSMTGGKWKGPRSGGVERGPPSVVTRGQLRGPAGQQGENPKPDSRNCSSDLVASRPVAQMNGVDVSCAFSRRGPRRGAGRDSVKTLSATGTLKRWLESRTDGAGCSARRPCSSPAGSARPGALATLAKAMVIVPNSRRRGIARLDHQHLRVVLDRRGRSGRGPGWG